MRSRSFGRLRALGAERARRFVTFVVTIPENFTEAEIKGYLAQQAYTRIHKQEVARLEVIQDRVRLNGENRSRIFEDVEKALKHGSEDKQTLFRLEFNAGLALLKMCAARQAGCDPARLEAHFVRASELNPESPETFFNLAAITNDIHHDSRRAMELFKKACDLGHSQACVQYDHFKSQFAAIDRPAQEPSATDRTVEALAERIRLTYACPSVVKSSKRPAEGGIVTWTIECSDKHAYTVIVGRTGETTVFQKSK